MTKQAKKSAAQSYKASNAEYHADRTAWSHSQLDVLIEDPGLFHARFITGELADQATWTMDLGSVVHTLVLEPDAVAEQVAIIPEHVLASNGARSGNKWKDFKEANDGKYLMKEGEFIQAQVMACNIQRHDMAAAILRSCVEREFNIRWTDPDTGLPLRCRLDIFGNIVADLKTAAEVRPQRFASACANYGYHRQVAMYQDGVLALTGERRRFAFIAVRNEPRYNCEVFELDQKFVDLGREQNKRALARLAQCLANDHWETNTFNDVITLPGPGWAFTDAKWELDL